MEIGLPRMDSAKNLLASRPFFNTSSSFMHCVMTGWLMDLETDIYTIFETVPHCAQFKSLPDILLFKRLSAAGGLDKHNGVVIYLCTHPVLTEVSRSSRSLLGLLAST